MNSNDITPTQGRLRAAIDNAVTKPIIPQVLPEIETAVEKERIRTGVITKFYPYLDKAMVELDNSDEVVLCKILHRFGGELIDLYTPSADSSDYCDELHEPCVVPRDSLNCLIVNIDDADSEEYLILGFYQNDEIVDLNPAAPGNLKLTYIGGTNQFWIKFGSDGLDLRLPKAATLNVGDMDKNMEEVDYADSTNVYTKDEVYTKEEVDELIRQRIAEALGDD